MRTGTRRSHRFRPPIHFRSGVILLSCVIAGAPGGFALTGCSTAPQPLAPVIVPEVPRASGSLWADAGGESFLFEDNRAKNVGDIVKVRIVESAKGAQNASSKSDRKSSIGASLSSAFDLPTSALGKFGLTGDYEDEFDGGGQISRTGSLDATMTAMVMEVLPGGNLRIQGSREVSINGEKEEMSLSGVIRVIDIDLNNTVMSTVIADAQIDYSGYGTVTGKMGPGWGTRLVRLIWPF